MDSNNRACNSFPLPSANFMSILFKKIYIYKLDTKYKHTWIF